jgi:hypothetical protein
MVIRDQQIPEERTLAILVLTSTTWPMIRISIEGIWALFRGIHLPFVPALPHGPPPIGKVHSLNWQPSPV